MKITWEIARCPIGGPIKSGSNSGSELSGHQSGHEIMVLRLLLL